MKKLVWGVLFLTMTTGCGQTTSPAPSQSQAAPAVSDEIGAVTDDMLFKGHRDKTSVWPTYGGEWGQTRYSPLDEIRRDNIRRLRPAWIAQTGVVGSFENTPIVLGREMYVTTPTEQRYQKVFRLDSATGEVLWQVRLEMQAKKGRGLVADSHDVYLPPGFGPHRGVAAYGNRLYLGTINGTLLALDRASGKNIFEVPTLSPSLTSAPLAAQGRIIVGLSWLDRGGIQAFDTESGKLLWTWRSIPSPEEGGWEGDYAERMPGREHISLERDIAKEKANRAKFTDAWKTGGVATIMTPSFDPELGLLYVSTGAPSPHGFPPPSEPPSGDMRWAASICAVRIENGQTAWCYQFVPHDVWGVSGGSPPFLFDFIQDGKTRQAVARFTGMGNLYVWGRDRGDLLKVSDNYIPVPETRGGKAGANLIRGGGTGTAWSPGAYSPRTGFAYSTNQSIPGRALAHEDSRDTRRFGNIAAVNVTTGEVVWQQRTNEPLVGGALATAGGLVFAGRSDGWFDAYDDATGERVWSFRTGAGCNAAPVAYSVGGRQHVAVACGGHGVRDPDGGDAILAFALVPE